MEDQRDVWSVNDMHEFADDLFHKLGGLIAEVIGSEQLTSRVIALSLSSFHKSAVMQPRYCNDKNIRKEKWL